MQWHHASMAEAWGSTQSEALGAGVDLAASFTAQAGAILGKISDGLGQAIAAAVPHCDASTGELVLDIEAMLRGMAAMPTRKIPSAGDWLRGWLSALGRSFPSTRSPRPAPPGLRPVISESMRGTIFPRALAIRDATMAQAEPVGLRHLLFALAELPPTRWPNALKPLAAADLLRLRQTIITETGKKPLRGEKMDAWAALLGAPPLEEHTPLLEDNPAVIDLLGRKPVAETLAIRLRRLQEGRAKGDGGALLVQLHGPWGSGKSSIVNFLRTELESGANPWLVVDFNVWRNARVKPPWWSLLTELRRQIARRQGWPQRLLLDLEWFWWRATRETLVLVAALALFGLGLWLLFSGSGDPAGRIQGWEENIKLFTGLASGAASLLVFSRSTFFGTVKAAEAFDALRTDAFEPVVRLFGRLIGHSSWPVLIVLDDLDRCDAATVTELLEGVQTLFREAPVVFLAVADRRWITTSFAQRFELFGKVVGDPARPLGDLFLDKIFQLSVGVPAITPEMRTAYLAGLLGQASATASTAAALPETARSHEELQTAIKTAPAEEQQALRAEAVRRLASPAADRAAKHRLMEFADLIEPNPRAMIRLVNAVGLNQARAIIEGREVPFKLIARWTLFEQRWPQAAALIGETPECIETGDDPALQTARADPLYPRIVGEQSDMAALTSANLRRLLG